MNVHIICAHSGQGCREGDITLRVESGDKRVKSKSWNKILYVAAGSDPFLLIERGKFKILRSNLAFTVEIQKLKIPSNSTVMSGIVAMIWHSYSLSA
jgi:hypothetical protein